MSAIEAAEAARVRVAQVFEAAEYENYWVTMLRALEITSVGSARGAAAVLWRAGWDAKHDGLPEEIAKLGWEAARLAWIAATPDPSSTDALARLGLTRKLSTVISVNSWLADDGYRARTDRFIDHYRGWHTIIVVDNGSSREICDRFGDYHNVEVVNLQPHLGRTSLQHTDYAYAWRNEFYQRELLERFEKVIYLENDCWVLSKRLMDYINGLTDGWTSLWCDYQKAPETALQVIIRGCEEYDAFTQGDPFRFLKSHGAMEDTVQEIVLPLTRIAFDFVGDRYGDFRPVPAPTAEMDFWCQAPVPEGLTPLRFLS